MEEKNDRKQRLRQIVDAGDFGKDELAEFLGKTIRTIDRYLSEKAGSPAPTKADIEVLEQKIENRGTSRHIVSDPYQGWHVLQKKEMPLEDRIIMTMRRIEHLLGSNILSGQIADSARKALPLLDANLKSIESIEKQYEALMSVLAPLIEIESE